VVHNPESLFDPSQRSGWWTSLLPKQQLGYGCLLILIMAAATLYCAGTASIAARPFVLQRPPTPTYISVATAPVKSTQAPTTLLQVPAGMLDATPTQARIPTREPWTLTPTVDLTNGAPITGTLAITMTRAAITGTLPITMTRTPTRKPIASPTIKP
jgi:hypothetical protein